MKSWKAWAKLHVYQKVIFVFVALVIPYSLINLWMNLEGQKYVRGDITDSTQSNVNFYSRQLDDQMSFIRNLQLQLLNEPELQKLNFLGKQINEFDSIQLVNRVRDRLIANLNSSDYLVNVGVYIKSFGRTISTQSGITPVPNAEYDVVAGYSELQPSRPLYYRDGKLFFLASANNAAIIAYFQLSVPRFEETLRPLVDRYGDSGALLADDTFRSRISFKTKDEVVKLIGDRIDAKMPDQPDASFTVRSGKQTYLVTNSRISTLGLTLFTYLNQNELTGQLRTFNIWYIVLSIVSIVIIVLFSFSVNLMIHKPLKRLIVSFKILEADSLIRSTGIRPNNEFGYLYRNFDQMVQRLKLSIRENYEQKIALQHSELKQLQSQINPHFLYNSFFNIYMICRSGDMEQASEMARRLGSYYQFITRSGKDEAHLVDEYRHALDYCEIQSIRFSNRIEVEADELPASCAAYEVPRIIVQPVVENAFEHAFENGRRRGHVYVRAAFENEVLRISVEDDGGGLQGEALQALQAKLAHATEAHEKTGLINVGRRIRLKFGETSGVFVSRSEQGGLKAEIVIHFSERGY
ncbi:two-component sensor histidine kinase [Paenibacillus rhizovicinus]|uniref:Two-component sensor histidine kinase n=1 Tax=Paenibacillus rhizovicinus TaxID=2704463 RepID=A0A6C0P052_9BACL|nr:histidine kinase [Paenibacillus rhizovicinus]QHW31900.1 two-component sensor histidine kinase [Paenibacillus rhizovicinus]